MTRMLVGCALAAVMAAAPSARVALTARRFWRRADAILRGGREITGRPNILAVRDLRRP